MFDVSWTDPMRETVGQRKSRKDYEGHSLSRTSSIRTWKSSDSSETRPRPSLLNLFGNGSNGNQSLRRAGSHSRFSSMRGKDMNRTSRRVSSYTTPSDTLAIEYSSPCWIPSSHFFDGGISHSDAEHSGASEVSESVFSGWTGRTNVTDSSWNSFLESPPGHTKLVQSLSTSSLVTQSTEITISPRESVRADEKLATIISISAANTMPIEIRDSHKNASHTSTIYNFPLPNSSRPESTDLLPSPEPKRNESHHGWPMTSRKSDSWKPPETWECPLEDDKMTSVSPTKSLGPPLVPIKNSRRKLPFKELSQLQRSIRHMESASPKIILERLQEEWLGVADAAVYRELELEKQLWMLTALESIKKKRSKVTVEQLEPQDPKNSSATKILSLYENYASSSFLSALCPQSSLHHISTSPLSPASHPNVHPLCVPLATAQLPYASNIFASIHAFSLPATLPAASIPVLLKECHRILVASPSTALLSPPSPTSPVSFSSSSTGTIIPLRRNEVTRAGTIHLTVLDPAPLPETLGPRLRAWLNDHLILNLERQFRCTIPSRLFPIWLSDAGLRAEGSTIVNVRFLACMENELGGRGEAEGSQSRESHGLKTEMKSVVGRMLWKAMWGSFVEGERWWWEDDEIVQECLERETYWQYSVIESVKER